MKKLLILVLLLICAGVLTGCGSEGTETDVYRMYRIYNTGKETEQYGFSDDGTVPKALANVTIIVAVETGDAEIEMIAKEQVKDALDNDLIWIEIDPDKEDVCIKTRGAGSGILSAAQCRTIADHARGKLSDGSVDEAWIGIVREIYSAASGKSVSPSPGQITVDIVTALLFGFLLNVICLRFLSSRQKSMVENVTKAPTGKAKFFRGKTDVHLEYGMNPFDDTLIGSMRNFFRD